MSDLNNRVIGIRVDQTCGSCEGTFFHFQFLKILEARLSLSDDACFEDDSEDDRCFGRANSTAIPPVICLRTFERSIREILEDLGSLGRQFHVCC